MSFAEWGNLISWRDVVDILVVAIVIYNLLLLIRGTRAVQILLGILFIGAMYYFAGLADLLTLQALLRSFLIILPFAVIVLFRKEIRRGLAIFGRNPLWGLSVHQEVESTINDLVIAATTLASKRIGALFVVQRLEGLRNYIENGIALDAKVSYDLLMNIFTPDTPLHDGAAIITQDRVAAAACFLPLTSNTRISTRYGTRHRAALGISEETDALAIVVSEETGAVSIALDGQLLTDLDSKALRNNLYQHLIADLNADPGKLQ